MSVPGMVDSNFLHRPGGVDRDVDDAGAIEAEHHPALQLGRGVVEVHDGPGRTHQRLEGPLDQLLAALHEHLDGHVVRDESLVDDLTLEVEVGLGGGGEPHFDLLEADVDQGAEQLQLALGVHGIDQGLVAVPQVDAGPTGRPVEVAVRPRPVGQGQRAVGPVEVEGHGRDVAGHVQPGLLPVLACR